MFIFGVCFVLHLIKLSAEKDIVYPAYIQGNCMFCNVTVLIGREVNIDIYIHVLDDQFHLKSTLNQFISKKKSLVKSLVMALANTLNILK